MLVSDVEREAALTRLRAAHLEGRLESTELESRVAVASAARTSDDLAEALNGLPEVDVEPDVTTGVPRVPGRRHFRERKLLRSAPAVVRIELLESVVPALERYGYRLHEERGDLLRLVDDRRDELSVRLRGTPDGRTVVVVHGVGPLRVRQAFARLRD